jgi:hypothetical protein
MREWRYLSSQPQRGETENRVDERHPQFDVKMGSGKNSEGIARTMETRNKKTKPQHSGEGIQRPSSVSRRLKDIGPKRGTRLHHL